MNETRIVVVGAGLAGVTAVTALREGGYPGGLTLVGAELEPPYERPALSKDFLQGKSAQEKLYVHHAGWYPEHGVRTIFGRGVVSIDRDARVVLLADGERLEYTDLVLAMGAGPRPLTVPGAHLPGVHYLRRISDSVALRQAIAAAQRVAIVGAGWIGLEVAAAARLAGREVTVLEVADRPLQMLGPEIGGFFADLHRRHGVDLRLGTRVTAIAGQKRVTGVELASGSVVPADLIVGAIGAAPETRLAEAAGLAIGPRGDGVLVDEWLRTSDPHILAAGDLANARNVTLGRHVRVEHWDNAIRQGKLVAATLLGGEARYDWQPFFYTDQYDLGMEYVGLSDPADSVTIRGEKASGQFLAFWQREGAVTAAMNVNIWGVNEQLRALLGRQVSATQLADPAIPLAQL